MESGGWQEMLVVPTVGWGEQCLKSVVRMYIILVGSGE